MRNRSSEPPGLLYLLSDRLDETSSLFDGGLLAVTARAEGGLVS